MIRRTSLLIIISVLVTARCSCQITLPAGFECYTDEQEWTVACHQLFGKNNTLIIAYGCDRGEYNEAKNKNEAIQLGVSNLFGPIPYKKTKDNLYVGTGVKKEEGGMMYYYRIFVPEKLLQITLQSETNNKAFSDLSTYILQQVRRHRKDEQFGFRTRDGNTCYFYRD